MGSGARRRITGPFIVRAWFHLGNRGEEGKRPTGVLAQWWWWEHGGEAVFGVCELGMGVRMS